MTDLARSVSACPMTLPPDLDAAIERLAALWQDSPLRPRASAGCLEQWKALVAEWLATEDIPVLIRAGAGRRGEELLHASGRVVVCTDNSPAHWSLSLALIGRCPTIDEIREAFRRDEIPVCMAMKNAERARAKYRCNRQTVNLNDLGWKVCHRVREGEGRPKISENAPWERISAHFCRFISPGNMFLVPKEWSGLGEIASVVRAFGELP